MSIQDEEKELICQFNQLDDWMAKYDYLMMEGILMPKLPKEECTQENLISGCHSKAWISIEQQGADIYLRAYSPSFIVSGILAIFIKLLSGHTSEEILAYELKFYQSMNLEHELGKDRNAGALAILNKIKNKIKEKKENGNCKRN